MSSVAHIIRRKRARKARQRTQNQRSSLWMVLVFLITGIVVIVPLAVILGVAGLLYIQAVNAMPTPAETIYLDPIIGATELYDRTGGTLIYTVEDPLGNQRRWIELEALPDYVVSATLLMEDSDYLRATHFDAFQTLNRLWRYILDAPLASDRTITGRLVRNAVLPLARKSGLDDELLEIALVAEAERQLSPHDLLEWHLNTNYYGNDAYGINAAAQVYLGKSAEDLTLDEAALLVAIPPAPRFNPFDNRVASYGRQTDLLLNMFNNALINKPQYDQSSAVVTPLRSDFIQKPLLAPDFAIYARQQTQDILDNLGMDGARMVARSGLKITTTLDVDLYIQSDCVLRAHLDRLNGGLGNILAQDNAPCRASDYLVQPFGADATASPDTGTLLLMDVTTGEIYSMVGDARSQNHQAGVVLQPFVYFEGFLQRLFTPASMVYDIPRAFPGPADGLIYTPTNPDGRFRGPLNLRDAMAAGLIPPAVHVADSRGINSSNPHRTSNGD